MKFFHPTRRGRLLRRYKRFLADVEWLDGGLETIHCPNPGRMTSCMQPGCEVLASHRPDPRRKLAYTWELSRVGEAWVVVNTQLANPLVEEWLRSESGSSSPLSASEIRREVPLEDRRIDFRLGFVSGPELYLEVKSVTLARAGVGFFPDAPSKRGVGQLEALTRHLRAGGRAGILYLLGREDVRGVGLAEDIDPSYAKAVAEARAGGLETYCLRTKVSPQEVRATQLEGPSRPAREKS